MRPAACSGFTYHVDGTCHLHVACVDRPPLQLDTAASQLSYRQTTCPGELTRVNELSGLYEMSGLYKLSDFYEMSGLYELSGLYEMTSLYV